jgi:hypothetical protein
VDTKVSTAELKMTKPSPQQTNNSTTSSFPATSPQQQQQQQAKSPKPGLSVETSPAAAKSPKSPSKGK